MDLPDCPPGTEGYEDDGGDLTSNIPKDATKGEREFAEYLHGLKLPLENGTTGRVLEQRTRDQSGQLVYACYPCSVTLYGEYMAKTHLNGRKHLSKLESRKLWPRTIYDNHPFESMLPRIETPVVTKPAQVAQVAIPAAALKSDEFQFDLTVVCKIQPDLDNFLSNPLIGLEYLVEILPNEDHHAPMYCCVLCSKTGHNSTMLNHLICMHHNFRYISVHFKEMYFAIKNIKPNRAAFQNVMDSLMRAIEENYGRMRPVQCTQLQWKTHNAAVSRAVTKREHVSEQMGKTFVEILDPNLMQHLSKVDPVASASDVISTEAQQKKKDPSPPVVAAPSRPANYRSKKEASPTRKAREGSLGALSNISSDHSPHKEQPPGRRHHEQRDYQTKYYPYESGRGWTKQGRGGRGSFSYHPYYDSRYKTANPYYVEPRERERPSESQAAEPPPADAPLSFYERQKLFYKLKKYEEKTQSELDNALKALAYHEKNPEKHPQYPDEWKKFWNRRYKEVKTENKDPSTHDFKPEWIIFWTKRMVELHEEKMEGKKRILRKQLGLPIDKSPTREPPPDPHSNEKVSLPHKLARSRSPMWRPPSAGRRSPSPGPRRRSPLSGRLSPRRRNPSPGGHRRRPSPVPRSRKISTPRDLRDTRHSKSREDFRPSSSRDEHRQRKARDESKRSKSPFSARASKGSPDRLASRNRSPQPVRGAEDLSPMSLSDDDHKLRKDALSPWGDSSSSLESVRSPKREDSTGGRRGHAPQVARSAPSARSAQTRALTKPPSSTGPEDVVPVLRLLAALEDYLGPSLGPKILDILGEALKMEKEKPNSSENILDVDEYTSLLEMCKEKLKGKVEAGLVGTAATLAAREVISRTAALLHLSELRHRDRKKEQMEAVKVTGVGAVDKAAVARQLAAALIAQGKTDVTTEELATLVDAVVGMAEAKRRAGQGEQPVTIANLLEKNPAEETQKQHSALKMLQAAYDDQHKPELTKAKTPVPVKEIPVDAMDGLSDSDLKTLMQNFKDLSTDEQEGLVAYLKKLEVRDPKRVENLRQFVDFGSDETPASPPPLSAKMATTTTNVAPATSRTATNNGHQGQAKITSQYNQSNVTLIDSDDDDYTVEEVFKSAVIKVREDLKQKEMEVVQKSIQHTKPEQKNETEKASDPADANRLLKLVQSTAGRGLFNAFSSQSSTPSHTSNVDTQAKGTRANVAPDWLSQRLQNNDTSVTTDSAGWTQNQQTGQNVIRVGQSRVYGDIQESNMQSESQLNNQNAQEFLGVQSESGMQDKSIISYQNQDIQYEQQGQYPQDVNFSQENFTLQDQLPQHSNFSQQDQFQQGNYPLQDQFSQRGNFSQQDQIFQQGNYFQQDQFSQQRNLSQQGDFAQDNFSQQNQFLQQGDNFTQKDQYLQHNLAQGAYSRQGEFSPRDQISQGANFQQGQFSRSEMQSRMGGNQNFNSRDQFQGGPQYPNVQGGSMGGQYVNDRKFGGPTRGRAAGGRGRGRGGRGQYPY